MPHDPNDPNHDHGHDHKVIVNDIRAFITMGIPLADALARRSKTKADDIGVAALRILVTNDEIADLLVEELNRLHPKLVQEAIAAK